MVRKESMEVEMTGHSLGRDKDEERVENGAEISTFCCSLRSGSQKKTIQNSKFGCGDGKEKMH